MGWLVLSQLLAPGLGVLQMKGTPGADVHTWDSQSPEDLHSEGTTGIRPA